jgi:hypothetical protein
MYRTRFRRCMGLFVFLISAAGCGKSGSMVPLSGTVKLDGQPLANATVHFIAQNSKGRDALGSTDAHGVFHLSTLKSGDGAFPGKYKVVVQPVAQADAGAVTAPPWAKVQPGAAAARKPNRPAVVLPPRYSQPDQTILVQDVPASGDVVYELHSK